MPGTGERTPPADAVLACPLTFNSVNKFAHGHADNFAVGLLCEMAGYGLSVMRHAFGKACCTPSAFGRFSEARVIRVRS
jgi:hypothetical protein